MKKMRILTLLSAAAIATALMAGCTKESGKGGESVTKDKETIKIGGLAPLTGDVSQYGIAVDNGVQMAVADINKNGGILGKQIEYIHEDEKGDPTEAVNAYNKLVEKDIVALVGDVTSKPTKAVALKAKADNMPMITASGTQEDITQVGENVFRACFIDPYQGKLMANYAAKKLNAKKAAILYDKDDSYSSGIANAFDAAAKEYGITITNKEGYASKSKDFSSQLTKIKANQPDVIMVPVYYTDVALIAVQAKTQGITSKLLGADGWDTVLDKIDASNVDALANSFFCSQYSDTSTDADLQAFLKAYEEKYKQKASMFSVLGYDAMRIMAAAIEKAGSTDSAKIIEALKSTNHKGLTGTTTFDANRNPVRQAIITSFEGNKYKFVENYAIT